MPTLIKVLKLENEEVSSVDHAHQILQKPKRGQNFFFMSLRKGKDAYKLPPSQFTVITTRPLGKQITCKSHIKHVAPGPGGVFWLVYTGQLQEDKNQKCPLS